MDGHISVNFNCSFNFFITGLKKRDEYKKQKIINCKLYNIYFN